MGLFGRYGRHEFIPLCMHCDAELRQVGAGADNPHLCINCEKKLTAQIEQQLKENQQRERERGGWWS